MASTIDAQDVEESGLFDEVIRYQDYDETVAELLKKLNPKRVAMDFSENDPECDGLTLGALPAFRNTNQGSDGIRGGQLRSLHSASEGSELPVIAGGYQWENT